MQPFFLLNTRNTLIAFMAVTLSACSDSNSGGADPSVGYFMGRGASGVSYQTETQSGVTGARGIYNYFPGERVTFSVGDIVFARDILAKRYITPPDFEPSLLPALNAGTTVKGLTTYAALERDLASGNRIIGNKTGLLRALDTDQDNTGGVQISDSVRADIEASPYAAQINFDINPNIFGSAIEDDDDKDDDEAPLVVNVSPETALFNDVCFPEDYNCDDNVSRSVRGGTSAADYIAAEARDAYFSIASGIFLSPRVLRVPAGDTRIWRVDVQLVGLEEHPVADLQVVPYGGLLICDPVLVGTPGTIPPEEDEDAVPPTPCADPSQIALEDTPVVIQAISTDQGWFEFFLDANAEPGEATIAVNVKLAGDYRWYLQNFRVLIE